ncbi:HAD-IA family hydrolase [Profundibacterium mesophilum]|uniref:phosphoglycolate phosphatase n=1 Tax=Profundibacterium mesophilum KAUST100406-0324 TaxID=1037889 RepID=A0A921TCH1_9RHOB|nr:HAD-IA family hydrolase [Profundibacterium mesophilum]KAF0674877.1 Phosphoglycolate phosphatase [Profundibacterium mesophilum KAUST100406-0324]
MAKTVIFDLDGTLADTGADLIAAANACFRGLGQGDQLDPARDKGTAFRGGRAMLRLGFERLGREGAHLDEGIEAQYPLLLDSYGENIDTHTVLYDGAAAAISELREAGYGVGICTNKPEALAETLLARMGCRDWFGALVGADTLAQRKPDPAPFHEAVRRAGGGDGAEGAVLVGDTDTDRQTARAAGVPCILVTFGPEGDRVSALGPEALLGDYRDLPVTVAKLIG